MHLPLQYIRHTNIHIIYKVSLIPRSPGTILASLNVDVYFEFAMTKLLNNKTTK